MSAVLYYFTSTGNSLTVARDLAEELGGAELVSMAKVMRDGNDAAYDTVGIIFPVYMFGLPLIVADFLKKVEVKKGAYIFAVATFGGLQGRAISLAKRILWERGLILSSGFSVMMPGNYTPLYGAIDEDRQKKMFEAEKVKVKEIASHLCRKETGLFEEAPRAPNLALYILLYRGGSARIRKGDADFWITEKCTRCGLCAKICPVGNIEMADGFPEWMHHCEHCMGCLQWCPVEAIQYKKNTVGRKRYRHPGVTAQDIML